MSVYNTVRRIIFSGAALLIASSAYAQECKNPDQLVLSIIPTEETTQEVNLYAPVLEALKANTGKRIEFFMPTSYASVVEALLSGWVNIGVLGPSSYMLAHDRDPKIEVFATYTKKAGHLQAEGPGFRSVLITRKNSDFGTIDSLKGKIVGLVEPASTSGDLLPRVVFGKEIKSELEDYFSKVVYTGGHDLSVLAVKEGRVDAAFVATHRFDNVVDRGLVTVDEFNVIWESPVVPQDPFVYRTDLCPDLQASIKKTFLELDKSEAAKGFFENINSNKFVEMSTKDYQIIWDIAASK